MPADHSSPDVSAAKIRAQRDRILASSVFSKSRRQCDFLDYVVNAALEGREDKLKEFTLGIDVFEKDDSFDPNIDSIVRVEASRLRGKLREYYVDQGQNDAVRIDIPKGHYVPVFSFVDRPKESGGLRTDRTFGPHLQLPQLLCRLSFSTTSQRIATRSHQRRFNLRHHKTALPCCRCATGQAHQKSILAKR